MLNATKYNWTRRRISERWGLPFWQLVADIYDQGFNRTKAALIIGMQRQAFNALLIQHPQNNPWGCSNVVANYVRDTGEPFRDALLRMQREGHSYDSAGRALGYVGKGAGTALRHAMTSRGIDVKFEWVRPIKDKPKRVDRVPNIGKGWPTWEKIYAMQRAPSR